MKITKRKNRLKSLITFALSLLILPCSLYADRPIVFLSVENDPDLKTLDVSASIIWNRVDLIVPAKRAQLQKKNIYCAAKEAEKITKLCKVGNRDLTLVMDFPPKGQGRTLNANARVEVSIYEDKTLLFKTKWFGQRSDEMTPLIGKFRPSLLRISSSPNTKNPNKGKDTLHLFISGEFGEDNTLNQSVRINGNKQQKTIVTIKDVSAMTFDLKEDDKFVITDDLLAKFLQP